MRAKEFITEHKPVFRRNPKTGHIQLFWRCESGLRKGRTVPKVADCSAAYDSEKAQRLKKTRARTYKNQSRLTKLTKKRSRASRVVNKLNKWLKPKKKRK
jgi:hypothetical protein